MILTGAVKLGQLHDELVASGEMLVSLSLSGATLLKVLADGSLVELSAAGQMAVTAHEQAAADAAAAEQAAESADATKRAQLQAARATLQTVVDTPNGSLSNAQVVDAVRVLCRAVLWIADRLIRKGFL